MRRTRPSPAMVVACLALFVALSGSAIALSRGSVGTRALKAGAVTTAKLKNGSVIGRKIRNGAVKSAKLRGGAVLSDKLATAAVTQPKIAAGAVTSNGLASDSVRRRKIAGSAVTSAKLANGAVTGPKLADGAVTAAKLAPDSVTGANVVDGSLGLSDIARTVAMVSFDPASVAGGSCGSQTVPTPGSLDAQPTLVLTGTAWDNRLFVAAAESEADQTSVLICNPTGGAVDGAAGELIFVRF